MLEYLDWTVLRQPELKEVTRVYEPEVMEMRYLIQLPNGLRAMGREVQKNVHPGGIGVLNGYLLQLPEVTGWETMSGRHEDGRCKWDDDESLSSPVGILPIPFAELVSSRPYVVIDQGENSRCWAFTTPLIDPWGGLQKHCWCCNETYVSKRRRHRNTAKHARNEQRAIVELP